MKRLLSVVMALVLLASFAIADEPTDDVTVDPHLPSSGSAEGSIYEPLTQRVMKLLVALLSCFTAKVQYQVWT